LTLEIGGVRLRVEPMEAGARLPRQRDAHARFAVEGGDRAPDLTMRVTGADPPPRPATARHVLVDPYLNVFATEGGFRFELAPPGWERLEKCMEVDIATWTARVWLLPLFYEEAGPCDVRLTELAVALFLGGAGTGLILHACAVSDGGRGLLFAGHSGDGKSTTARLWGEAVPEARLLTDDRAIVRPVPGSGFELYGTPWHGEAEACAAGSARLERIFFLEKAGANAREPLEPTEAVRRLLSHAIMAFFWPEAVATTFEWAAQLAESLPCERFAFTRSSGAVKYARAPGTSRGPGAGSPR
jgi:hypothetical protein